MIARSSLLVCVLTLAVQSQSSSQLLPLPELQGPYDPAIISPAGFLGRPVGAKPVRYDEVVGYIRALAEQSPKVRLTEFGATHEGRALYYLTISAEENLKRTDEIRGLIARLGNPRVPPPEGAARLARSIPAVVWIGYGIHGDELSSVDAALQVAYQLAAGQNPQTDKVLRELVVCIDPIENPDGRERFLNQMEQWGGVVANSDLQSMHHTGMWPYGRGNHYLFDLNRDWILLVHPESRARVRTIREWNPQVLIDSHEMGAYDTYLFSPATEPINPNVSAFTEKWWKIFAADHARAFDRHGWSYYTREWNDEWYPGYASAWGIFVGVVGILYEQAGVDGTLMKRPDGTTMTFGESVQHHIVSSLANLATAADHRVELLEDFARVRSVMAKPAPGDPRAFYLVPGENKSRLRDLIDLLLTEGIEVARSDGEIEASGLRDVRGSRMGSQRLPAGTYVVSLEQPMGRLAKTILEFDPRMKTSFLQQERKSLEKRGRSKMYDVTSWSLPLAYNVEAYWSEGNPSGKLVPVASLPEQVGSVTNTAPGYGFLFDYRDDCAVRAAAMLLGERYTVRAAKEPFTIEGRSYDRGAILLRLHDNPDTIAAAIVRVAAATGVHVHGVNTALSSSGPDLGGNDFVLLREPKVAVVAGPEISTTGFGALWHLLDARVQMRFTIMATHLLQSADLRKYNVLVLPPVWNPDSYTRMLGKEGLSRLRDWVEAGGTLIGIGTGAAFLSDTAAGFSLTRQRRQMLKDLRLYARWVQIERLAESLEIDSVALWSGTMRPPDTVGVSRADTSSEKDLERRDERGRLFKPRGALLQVELDTEHWLAFGEGESVPVTTNTSFALLSRHPVETPARFADAPRLRLSGLLWPEARERWERTAYATREGKGKGQVILFLDEPNYRGSFSGSTRLLLNSLLLGPGFGSEAPVEW